MIENNTLKSMYESGMTIQELAHNFNRSYSAIYERLQRAGTEFRPRSAHLPRGIKEGDTECKFGHKLPNPIKRNQNGLYCQACRTKAQSERRKGVSSN